MKQNAISNNLGHLVRFKIFLDLNKKSNKSCPELSAFTVLHIETSECIEFNGFLV
jgi:hypothetical protein